jgi:hypothetical protein
VPAAPQQLTLAVVPGIAQQTLYDNGSVDAKTDAWQINFGFSVSDSIRHSTSKSNVRNASIAVWLFRVTL